MPQTMKTYKEFIEDIQESSLSRIQSKSKKSGVAAISADRGNLSRKENQARSQQLQKDIRGKFGRGPTKVKGSYLENPGSKDERKVKEKIRISQTFSLAFSGLPAALASTTLKFHALAGRFAIIFSYANFALSASTISWVNQTPRNFSFLVLI